MNKNDSDFPTRIRFIYETDPQARLQWAHGIWGGINQQGEIEMNFYQESDRLPASTEQLIAADGTLGHELPPADGDAHEIVRHIHSRVLINHQTARAMLEWLEDRVSVLEEDGPRENYDPSSGIEQ